MSHAQGEFFRNLLGAIEMAEAQLLYGRNEQLRRIAQEIIVTQREEIAAMKLAIAAATEA
jgi:uncharacterized protein (DUF305 family)